MAVVFRRLPFRAVCSRIGSGTPTTSLAPCVLLPHEPPCPSCRILSTSPSPSTLGTQWRAISSTRAVLHGSSKNLERAKEVTLRWVDKKGDVRETTAKCGESLLEVAHRQGIELEGACEGVCACSTCHVILEGDIYDSLPEASEEEEDMLDQAFGLTATSRLGCQVEVHEGMHQARIKLPAATRNFYVDGHVPKPH